MEDNQGGFWLGTWKQGLIYFNPMDGTLKQYTEENGLLDDRIRGLLPGENGNYWLSTDKGLVKFDSKNEKFISEGFPKEHFSFNGIKSRDGQLFFGSKEGVYAFYPDQINGNPFPPDVLIHSLQISGEPFNIAQVASGKINLSHQQNDFSFDYSGIHHNSPAENQYQYQLSPYDDGWVAAGTQRNVQYTNLDPGDYTFQVKAANSDGVWSEENANISFVIHPPWWQTWWAYCLFTMAGLSVLGGFYFRFQNNIKAKQQQIEQQQQQLEKEQALNNQLADLNKANSRFVPTDFLQLLGKESILDLQLGDQTSTKMTILFADIRDYTGLSENMTPEQNFKFINTYLGRMGPIIKNHGGFICQYFGDGIMALFKENHAQAVQAAIEMQKTLNFYNETRQEQGKSAIRVGIGLNTGQLMLGVIGDEERYDSSVISDAVNTAARMEGLTKIFGCMLIISETTMEELKVDDTLKVSPTLSSKLKEEDNLRDTGKVSSKKTYSHRFLGKVKVKGKKIALSIYDFYDGDPADIQELKTSTKAGLKKLCITILTKTLARRQIY